MQPGKSRVSRGIENDPGWPEFWEIGRHGMRYRSAITLKILENRGYSGGDSSGIYSTGYKFKEI
jgi:hypothetical protein